MYVENIKIAPQKELFLHILFLSRTHKKTSSKLKMPRKELVIVTRSAQKRMNEETVTHAPVKKRRVATMKELAEEFNKNKLKNRETNFFDQFYNEHVLIFPWLKKESLRWHIRSSNGSKVNLDAAFDRNTPTKTTFQ